MSRETKHYCDRCKKEFLEKRLNCVKIELNPRNTYASSLIKVKYALEVYDLCNDCAEKMGFTMEDKSSEKKVVEPTTAEQLYDVVAKMISEING